jgi:predicted alpha/beta superfamily hydrolase
MRQFSASILALTLTVLFCACSSDQPRPVTAGPTVQVLSPALVMPGLDRTRTLRIYLPPSYANSDRHYPVIYMHDGQNLFNDATAYAGEWGVDETMDDLARTYQFEAIVVGIDNGGEKRMNELSPWTNARFGAAEGEQYLAFMVDTVKPYIDQNYRTEPGRNSTAIIGSSMGGLESHYAVHARPDVYGKAGLVSPSYWYAPEVYAYTEAHPPPPGTRLYLYAGGKEGAEMTDGARRMHALLAEQMAAPADLTLRIVAAADHNEAAWRAEFPQLVTWLFELQQKPTAP